MAAANANINIQMIGLELDSGTAKAASQTVSPGEQVPLGTVVKVSFVYEDSIA